MKQFNDTTLFQGIFCIKILNGIIFWNQKITEKYDQKQLKVITVQKKQKMLLILCNLKDSYV